MNKLIPSIPGTSASRKQWYIGLIVVALVVVLVSVYFGTKQFAGQASGTGITTTPLTEGQAGIVSTTLSSSGTLNTLTIEIGANLGTDNSLNPPGLYRTVAYDFTLNFPSTLRLLAIGDPVTPLDNWGSGDAVFTRITPATNSISFERANLDHTKALTGGPISLARITFTFSGKLTSADYQALQFSSFHVYNLEDEADLISTTVGGSGGTEIQQCTEAQCRTDFGLIAGSECTASTQDECLSAYTTNLMLRSECQPGTTVDGTSCSAYYGSNTAERDTLCGAWLDTLDATRLTSELSSDQITALCGAGATQRFNADLNGDTFVNDGDIIIIQLAMMAKESRYNTCGASGEASCAFPGVFVCENLENSYTSSIASCGE